MRLRIAVLALAIAGLGAGTAGATSTNCAVNASGGYKNCLSFVNPGAEQAKAWHATGLPYRFQLVRFSDGAVWGWWQWNDLAYHAVTVNVAGTITAQVDNMGTANPASWFVEMI